MKKVVLLVGFLTISIQLISQEYVQTTTNSTYAGKSFSTTGNISLGFNGTNLPNGSNANIKSKTSWGNWMTFIDGFSNDGYVFHNPNNGGRMELFHVDGATGTKKFGVFTVLKNGNIGIGTASPQEKLHVKGNTLIENQLTTQSGIIDTDGYSGWIPFQIGKERQVDRRNFEFVVAPTTSSSGLLAHYISDNSNVTRYNLTLQNDKSYIDLRDENNSNFFKVSRETGTNSTYIHMPKAGSRIVIGDYGGYLANEGYNLVVKNGSALIENAIYTNGQVGIGTTDTKGYELAVAGRAIAEEVRVMLQTSWPDYVFTKDYQLPSLQQVEQHIADKGHLINIPSAAEVVEDGIYLGEMNAKLLEKIEELTLYTIAQEKKLTEQDQKINELQEVKAKNKELEARLSKIEALLNKKNKF